MARPRPSLSICGSNETGGEFLQFLVAHDAGWIGLCRWRGCVLEVVRHEHSQAAGGDAQNQASFGVGRNDGLDEIELFEEGVEKPRQVHGLKLAAVTRHFRLQIVLDDAARGTFMVAAEAASAKSGYAAAASGGEGEGADGATRHGSAP